MRWAYSALAAVITFTILTQSAQRALRTDEGNRMSEEAIIKEIESDIERAVEKDRFSGAALIAKDGKPIFRKAYGLANKEENVPNRTDTKFNLGSISKSFTSVSIVQLAQEGKLNFTDTILKHLPDYPNKTVASSVTIHQLLTHTSGMGGYFNEEFMRRRSSFKTLSDVLPLFANDPLAFPPGADVRYSNAGYVVLGLIIERLSGMSYFDYVKERIFKPAGMTDTDSFERDLKVPNLAKGYTRMSPIGEMSGERRDNTSRLQGKGNSAGGGYSTVGDMLKFADALLKHKLLNPKYTEILFTGKGLGGAEMSGGGYGFTFKETARTRIVGNGGGFPGVNAIFRIYIDSGYTVVVLSNYDPPSAEHVAKDIEESLSVS